MQDNDNEWIMKQFIYKKKYEDKDTDDGVFSVLRLANVAMVTSLCACEFYLRLVFIAACLSWWDQVVAATTVITQASVLHCRHLAVPRSSIFIIFRKKIIVRVDTWSSGR